MSNWGGELEYVDDVDFRRASFDAWLSWEFMQRSFAGCSEELIPSQMGELCGKTTWASRKIAQRALHSARVTQLV